MVELHLGKYVDHRDSITRQDVYEFLTPRVFNFYDTANAIYFDFIVNHTDSLGNLTNLYESVGDYYESYFEITSRSPIILQDSVYVAQIEGVFCASLMTTSSLIWEPAGTVQGNFSGKVKLE